MSATLIRTSGAVERFAGGVPGVYPGIDFRTYVELDAVNWHTLEPFRISPRHARHRMTMPSDASDSQVFGEAAHTAILEPEKFAAKYAAMPRFEGHPNSNAHKDKKAEWIRENAHKVSLTSDEILEINVMADAVRSHAVAGPIVSGHGRNELAVVWKDVPTGALCKGRVDRLCRVPIRVLDPHTSQPDADAICLVDVKTTRAIAPRQFEREREKFAYHAQIAFYMDGVMAHNPTPLVPVLLAVENCNSFDVVVYRLEDELIEHGRKLYRGLLSQLLGCRATKKWPGISSIVLTAGMTNWEAMEVANGDQ